MFRRHLLALVLSLIAASPVAYAQGEGRLNDILSGRPFDSKQPFGTPFSTPSQATVTAQIVPPIAGRPPMLSVTANIAPGWYTYSTKPQGDGQVSTSFALNSSNAAILAGEFRSTLPPEQNKNDKGKITEKLHGSVTWEAPLNITAGTNLSTLSLSGSVNMMFCDAGSCQPAQDFPFTAQLQRNDLPIDAFATATGNFAPEDSHVVFRGNIDPKVVARGTDAMLVITAEPTKNFHLYGIATAESKEIGSKPTLIALTNTSGFEVGPIHSSAKPHKAPTKLPDDPVMWIYEGPISFTIPLRVPKDTPTGKYLIEGLIGFQTCSEQGCDIPSGARFAATLTVGLSPSEGSAPLAFASAKYGEAAMAAAALPMMLGSAQLGGMASTYTSLPVVLMFSLLGGFILNFMPCVLPVIGLKILSFAQQSGKSRRHVLALNLWYTLGTLLVFWILALLAATLNLGWGQQFQSATFNIVLLSVVFVMALSFLGVWEIPIPGFVGSGKAADIASRDGGVGAFAKGMLTTVLATPCSGPFLGPVFAFTLNKPPQVIFMIFTAIGVGMCAPYLVIGAFPRLIRLLPKPGMWMETFKQVMGFVLMFTVVYLFSLLPADYMVPAFTLLIGLWAACWWIGHTPLVERLGRRLLAWGEGAAFAVMIGLFAFTWLVPQPALIPWKDFSVAKLAQENNAGNTVLVEFWAEWCWNCRLNKERVIETQEVLQALDRNGVVPLFADYTGYSAEIKQTLAELQSTSIPLLALFPADRSRPPIILRDIITKQQLLEAIEQAGPSKVAIEATVSTAQR